MHSVQTQNTVLGIYIPRFEEERRVVGAQGARAQPRVRVSSDRNLDVIGPVQPCLCKFLAFERHYCTSGGCDTTQTRFILCPSSGPPHNGDSVPFLPCFGPSPVVFMQTEEQQGTNAYLRLHT